jgi:hypothetical protein
MRALCTAVAGALILAASAIPAKVNAATLTLLGQSGFSPNIVSSTDILETVAGGTALAYAIDWIEFMVSPSTVGTVDVDVISSLPYPNETYQVVAGGVNGAVVLGPLPALNIPEPVGLMGGIIYYLEVASAQPNPVGGSQGSIQVSGTEEGTMPLPGALALFAGGLGLLGFAGLRRSRKTGRGLAPAA